MGEASREDYVRDCCRRVMQMVGELHKLGYEGLRIVPGMAPSGMHWRCGVTHVGNIRADDGALNVDDRQVVQYTSAAEDRFFDWEDAEGDGPVELARKFLAREPEMAAQGKVKDPEYVEWYQEMVDFCVPEDVFPLAYDDDWDDPDPGCMKTTADSTHKCNSSELG